VSSESSPNGTARTDTRPLVTFALFAYNQERYIREAVKGAFSQTYEPLEIVLSDDCSTDCTYAIMQELVRDYNGSHSVTLNRNVNNLGIAAHLNKVVELSHGHLLVESAGDDISLPNRTERLYVEWAAHRCVAGCVFSNAEVIDEESRPQGLLFESAPTPLAVTPADYLRYGDCWVAGATNAFSIELYKRFGPMPARVIHEDHILAFRALLLDGTVYIPDVLVKYRRHSGNTYNATSKHCQDRVYKSRRYTLRGFLEDLRKCSPDCETALRLLLLRQLATRIASSILMDVPVVGPWMVRLLVRVRDHVKRIRFRVRHSGSQSR
jgi:glycosyltransferase involved in cell wall biosynthesis